MRYKAGTEAPLTRFSEEHQEDLYRKTIAMLRKIPAWRGVTPWILADFRSPRRVLPNVQDGWNRKCRPWLSVGRTKGVFERPGTIQPHQGCPCRYRRTQVAFVGAVLMTRICRGRVCRSSRRANPALGAGAAGVARRGPGQLDLPDRRPPRLSHHQDAWHGHPAQRQAGLPARHLRSRGEPAARRAGVLRR
jgi:hypothetical protein